MHVANLELCHELYVLSRWCNTAMMYPCDAEMFVDEEDDERSEPYYPKDGSTICDRDFPAYDLGYLWRKLPPSIKIELEKRVYYDDTDEWSVDLTVWYGDSFYWTDDFPTAEDALAALHIRLLKDPDVEDLTPELSSKEKES